MNYDEFVLIDEDVVVELREDHEQVMTSAPSGLVGYIPAGMEYEPENVKFITRFQLGINTDKYKVILPDGATPAFEPIFGRQPGDWIEEQIKVRGLGY